MRGKAGVAGAAPGIPKPSRAQTQCITPPRLVRSFPKLSPESRTAPSKQRLSYHLSPNGYPLILAIPYFLFLVQVCALGTDSSLLDLEHIGLLLRLTQRNNLHTTDARGCFALFSTSTETLWLFRLSCWRLAWCRSGLFCTINLIQQENRFL